MSSARSLLGVVAVISLAAVVTCAVVAGRPFYETETFDNSQGQDSLEVSEEIILKDASTCSEAKMKIKFLDGTTPRCSTVAEHRFVLKLRIPAGGKVEKQICIGEGPVPEVVGRSQKPVSGGSTQQKATQPGTEPKYSFDGRADSLRVRNEGQLVSVQLESIQVAVTTTVIPFSQFFYGNPAVNALPWITLGPTPANLAPGASVAYGIPGRPSAVGKALYARMTFSEGSPATRQRIVRMAPEGMDIPAFNTWTLLAMIACLTLVGIWTLRRTRKQVS
jgi:hypothetical protein